MISFFENIKLIDQFPYQNCVLKLSLVKEFYVKSPFSPFVMFICLLPFLINFFHYKNYVYFKKVQKWIQCCNYMIVVWEVTSISFNSLNRGAQNKPYLTAEQFRDFMNTQQRDPRLNEILYPYTDTAKAQALIDQFEPFVQKSKCSLVILNPVPKTVESWMVTLNAMFL